MMTLAEVRLLMDRRIAAIRWTIAELTLELAKLESDGGNSQRSDMESD